MFLQNYAILLSEKINKREYSMYVNNINAMIKTFENNEEVIIFLANRSISKEKKNDLIHLILKQFHLLKLSNVSRAIIDFNRGEYFFKIFILLLKKLKEYYSIVSVELYTAIKLNKIDINKIISTVQKKVNRKIKYDVIVDESLIGGFIIKSEDFTIDNSIKSRLLDLKNELKGGE
jgi:F-type H+-transporting ATPase subunit delta